MNRGPSTTGSAAEFHSVGTGSSPVVRSIYVGDKEDIIRIKKIICENHYAHSFPSGKTYCFEYEDAIVTISIPANNNVSKWLVGEKNRVWELSRLWAPDVLLRQRNLGKASVERCNLLTEAIAAAVTIFRRLEPDAWALISYCDPNADGNTKIAHTGAVYRAASWTSLGQGEDGRYFMHAETGQVVARRKFHAGKTFIKDAEIVKLGYKRANKPGKWRFGRGLCAKGRKLVVRKAAEIAEITEKIKQSKNPRSARDSGLR